MNLKSIYEMWSWTCAIRFNNDESTSLLTDKESKFTVIPNSNKYWTADPFLFEKNGKIYLFFEAFDIFKRKGLLGYRTVSENGFGDINIIFEHSSHLSFPFIYDEDGEIYIIPESAKSGELFRLRCTDFPDKWVKEDTLLEESVVDSVRLVYNDVPYLITEKVDDSHIYDRVDLYQFSRDGLIECANNPVKRDASSARGAGAICCINGEYIRPSQDCSDSYGEKLNFNKIISIDDNSFKEESVAKLTYRDINVDADFDIDGIHTYSKLKNIEVIDLRIPGKFNLRYTMGFINKIFDKLFK